MSNSGGDVPLRLAYVVVLIDDHARVGILKQQVFEACVRIVAQLFAKFINIFFQRPAKDLDLCCHCYSCTEPILSLYYVKRVAAYDTF